jgi:nitrogen regulatory protein P-II 1
MKKLGIIIPHERLQEVNDILHKHKVGGMTFYDIKGRGRSKEESAAVGRGVVRYVPEFVSRMKIEVLVRDSQAKPIIDDILDVISTGSHYDGKIFVYYVTEAYDIGTNQTSNSAIVSNFFLIMSLMVIFIGIYNFIMIF